MENGAAEAEFEGDRFASLKADLGIFWFLKKILPGKQKLNKLYQLYYGMLISEIMSSKNGKSSEPLFENGTSFFIKIISRYFWLPGSKATKMGMDQKIKIKSTKNLSLC